MIPDTEGQETNTTKTAPYRKDELEVQKDLKDASSVLEAIDRELAFYRRRAGQVFFMGLLVEVLILAGREKVVVPATWPWVQPFAYGILFAVVAVIGMALGLEYRRRIHDLKESRTNILKRLDYKDIYPPTGGHRLSEIQVLYVVLIFLSSSGLILVWLNSLQTDNAFSWTFWLLFWPFVITGVSGVCYALWKVVRWLR